MVVVVEIEARAHTVTWIGEREAVYTCLGAYAAYAEHRREYRSTGLHTLVEVRLQRVYCRSVLTGLSF